MRCTKPLKGLVKYIECGNELEPSLKISGDGSRLRDWDPRVAVVPWRDPRHDRRRKGDRSHDQLRRQRRHPDGYRALQMLWTASRRMAPRNGVGGAASCAGTSRRITGIRARATSSAAGHNNACVNVLQILKDSFGVPIWLTEWGWSGWRGLGSGSRGLRTTALTEYLSLKDKYNIQSVMMYTPHRCPLRPDQAGRHGQESRLTPATSKNFVAANPV